MRNFRFRQRRLEMGCTQEELAELLGVDTKTVRRYERGDVAYPQTEEIGRRIRERMGVPTLQAVGFAPRRRRGPRGTVEPVAESVARSSANEARGPAVLVRRDMLAIVSSAMAGTMATQVLDLFPPKKGTVLVGAADVERVRSLSADTYRIEHAMGGGVINPDALTHHFGSALDKLHGTYRNAEVRAEMHAAVAEYGRHVSWSLVDQGEHAVAQRAYGATLAATAGIRNTQYRDTLRADIFGDMARQEIYLGRHRDALALLDYVSAWQSHLPQDVRAIMDARRARALGGLGDAVEVARLAGAAEAGFADSDQTSAAKYGTSGFGPAELQSDLGDAYASLVTVHGKGDGDTAHQRLTRSIESYGDGETRSQVLSALRLANVHIAQGDEPQAVAVLERYKAQAQFVRSAQISEGIATGLRLATRGRGMSDVTELLQDLHRAM